LLDSRREKKEIGGETKLDKREEKNQREENNVQSGKKKLGGKKKSETTAGRKTRAFYLDCMNKPSFFI
jgi:hypothetical protein